MNFKKLTNKIMGKRHKPRSCHSRRHKTIQKRFTLGKVVAAPPKSPFLTVSYYEPKTEEERKAIEFQQMLMMMSGVVVGPMAFVDPAKFESLLNNAG